MTTSSERCMSPRASEASASHIGPGIGRGPLLTTTADDSTSTSCATTGSASASASATGTSTSVGCGPHSWTSVRGKSPPIETLSWNRGRSRRHGIVRRFSYCPRPHPEDQFCETVESVVPTGIGQVNPVRAKGRPELGQFLVHGGGVFSRQTRVSKTQNCPSSSLPTV